MKRHLYYRVVQNFSTGFHCDGLIFMDIVSPKYFLVDSQSHEHIQRFYRQSIVSLSLNKLKLDMCIIFIYLNLISCFIMVLNVLPLIIPHELQIRYEQNRVCLTHDRALLSLIFHKTNSSHE